MALKSCGYAFTLKWMNVSVYVCMCGGWLFYYIYVIKKNAIIFRMSKWITI